MQLDVAGITPGELQASQERCYLEKHSAVCLQQQHLAPHKGNCVEYRVCYSWMSVRKQKGPHQAPERRRFHIVHPLSVSCMLSLNIVTEVACYAVVSQSPRAQVVAHGSSSSSGALRAGADSDSM